MEHLNFKQWWRGGGHYFLAYVAGRIESVHKVLIAVELCGAMELSYVENKEEMLTSCGFAAKTLKHKNNLASYAGSEIFSL